MTRAGEWKDFALLLTGQSVSQVGSSMTSFGLVLWAYSSTGQVMASSLLAVCSTVPYLAVSLFGGAVVDQADKKKLLLLCDAAAAFGTCVILLCSMAGILKLWILCAVNILSGLMNAFQKPASDVAVTLLVKKYGYARAGGIQSSVSSFTGILTPVLAAALLGLGGLPLVLAIDLGTFAFGFLTLLFLVKIPDSTGKKERISFHEVCGGAAEGLHFFQKEREIFLLLALYSVLEFAGAISFDSMYSPLILARTGNDQLAVGIVSSFMAAGCVAASLLLTFTKQRKNKLSAMYLGSFLCLAGIALFGTGRSLTAWCLIVFVGCFGSPIYQTYQSVILREKVDVTMQGRIFSLQGMMTGILTPLGYVTGALLADKVFEPFMRGSGRKIKFLVWLVGEGEGAGMGLIFLAAGLLGMVVLAVVGGRLRDISTFPRQSDLI